MQVYVITYNYHNFDEDVINETEVLGQGFKTLERADEYLLEKGFVSNYQDSDVYWNKYAKVDVEENDCVFATIKGVIIQQN